MTLSLTELKCLFDEADKTNPSLELLCECEKTFFFFIRSEVYVRHASLLDLIQQALAVTCRAIVLLKKQGDDPRSEFFECVIAIRRSLAIIERAFHMSVAAIDDQQLKEVKDQLCAVVPRNISHQMLSQAEQVLSRLSMEKTANLEIQEALKLTSFVAQMNYEHRINGVSVSVDYFKHLIQMRKLIIELCMER